MRVKRELSIRLINKLFCFTRFWNIKRLLLKVAGINIGNSYIVGPIYLGSMINIKIGNGCWLGKDLSMDGDGKIEIEDNVDIAPHVVISTGSHEIGTEARRAGEGVVKKIKIGSGTWIGTNVTIVNDTIIGSGCVIAAGSVVTGDIPDNVLAAGVPAKVKKKLE